jgi:hypothetical protein
MYGHFRRVLLLAFSTEEVGKWKTEDDFVDERKDKQNK